MGNYLTKRGNSYVFQLRPPKYLDPSFRLAPIRVTLGPMSARHARRVATILAGSAHSWLGKHRWKMTEPSSAIKEFEAQVRFLMPLLRAMDDAESPGSDNDVMAELMSHTGLDGITNLLRDRLNGGFLSSLDGKALERYYTRIIKDEGTARAHFGFEPAPPKQSVFDELSTHVRDIKDGLAAIEKKMEPKLGPLFSQAAAEYYGKVLEAKGPDDKELDYIKHRWIAFLQICEDKPVGLYREKDIQHFVNEIQYLHPDYAEQQGYDVNKLTVYMAENKANGGQRLARTTIEDNYLYRLKAIIRNGCKSADIPYPLDKISIIYPPEVPKPRNQIPPDYPALESIFRKGLATKVLVDAILPSLGFIAGRRLGILSYLRAEEIKYYHGCFVVAPKDIIIENNKRIVVPIKTEDSLNLYVLNNFFVKIGLVDWMRRQTGFIFKHLHEGVENPAGTSSKRMLRLFDGETEEGLLQTFQALRHGRKNEDKDSKLNVSASRLQAGRAPKDVHDAYGRGVLTSLEVQAIANAPLPAEIDWTMFEGLDFDELAGNKRWPRHFAKNWKSSKAISGEKAVEATSPTQVKNGSASEADKSKEVKKKRR